MKSKAYLEELRNKSVDELSQELEEYGQNH